MMTRKQTYIYVFEIGGVQPDNFEEFVMELDNIETIAVFFGDEEAEAHCGEVLLKHNEVR